MASPVSTGVIVGAVIGALVGVLLIIFTVRHLYVKNQEIKHRRFDDDFVMATSDGGIALKSIEEMLIQESDRSKLGPDVDVQDLEDKGANLL